MSRNSQKVFPWRSRPEGCHTVREMLRMMTIARLDRGTKSVRKALHSPTRNFFRPGTHLSDFHLYQAFLIGLRGCDDMAGLALKVLTFFAARSHP